MQYTGQMENTYLSLETNDNELPSERKRSRGPSTSWAPAGNFRWWYLHLHCLPTSPKRAATISLKALFNATINIHAKTRRKGFQFHAHSIHHLLPSTPFTPRRPLNLTLTQNELIIPFPTPESAPRRQILHIEDPKLSSFDGYASVPRSYLTDDNKRKRVTAVEATRGQGGHGEKGGRDG